MGHIYRCLNLANRLRKHKLIFLIEDFGGTKEIFLNKKFRNVKIIKPIKNVDEDIKKTLSLIKKEKPQVIVIDKYNIKKKYLKQISKVTKVVFISDLNRIEFPANVVINGFIGLKNQIIKNSFGALCYLGPTYAILDEKFSNHSKTKKKYDLLVTFGGFDEKNITKIFLNELIRSKKKIKTKIILGPASQNFKEIEKMILYNDELIKVVNFTNNMHKEISASKYGICSGGMTTYEFAALQVPFGIICQVTHQLLTAIKWKKLGYASNFGLVDSKTKNKIRKFLNEIEYGGIKLPSKAKKIVDGNGVKRVAEIIENV